MKNLIYLFLFACIGFATFFTFSCKENIPVKQEVIKKDSIPQKIKVVFVVTGKNIDFNKMAIDEIIEKIENDTLLVNSVTPEFYIKPQIIKVYKIDDITCPYLKKRFKDNMAGELVYEYGDKLLVKLNDGVIKVYHFHLNEIKK